MIRRINGIAVLLLLFCALFFSATSYAWLYNSTSFESDSLKGATLTQYFAGGDGLTEETAFRITLPEHLYNLTWLQNKNYFTEGHNGETPKSYYFKLDADIDMAGALSGTTSETGAIPPIGSKANPFIGYFDGQGHTVSNLWVSSEPTDWRESPEYDAAEDYSYGVGLFGYIQRPDGDDTSQVYAGNFYLQNIEVTVKADATNTTVVGLAAGHVDAAMSKIGVENGIISVYGTGTQIKSDHALIGEITEDTTWGDYGPGNDAGGDLVIAPSGLKDANGNVLYGKTTSVTSGSQAVDGAAKLPDGRYAAYYYGEISVDVPQPNPNKFSDNIKVYNGSNVSFSDGSVTLTTSNTVIASAYSPADESAQRSYSAFANYLEGYREISGDYQVIKMGGTSYAKPDFSAEYPTNCIWFQPMNTGHCYIAFGVENKSGNSYVSIYRYTRNSDGTINGTPQEFQVVFDKGSFNNGNVVMIDFVLGDADLKDTNGNAYEYCIGNSNVTGKINPAYFFFLTLAGVDQTGGGAEGGTTRFMEKIEFLNIESFKGTYSGGLSDENYKQPDFTDLKITGTSSGDISLKFNEIDGIVHYLDGTDGNAGDIVISEQITDGKSLEDNADSLSTYPERITGSA